MFILNVAPTILRIDCSSDLHLDLLIVGDSLKASVGGDFLQSFGQLSWLPADLPSFSRAVTKLQGSSQAASNLAARGLGDKGSGI